MISDLKGLTCDDDGVDDIIRHIFCKSCSIISSKTSSIDGHNTVICSDTIYEEVVYLRDEKRLSLVVKMHLFFGRIYPKDLPRQIEYDKHHCGRDICCRRGIHLCDESKICVCFFSSFLFLST